MDLEQNSLGNQNLRCIEKRQYVCDFCEKKFNTETNLRRHFYAIHNVSSISKSQQCNICTKAFNTQQNLTLHIHTVHESHKDHKCESCSKSFSQAGHLKRHIQSIHDGLKNYKCSFCGKFLTLKNLDEFHDHKKSIHNWCKYCDEYFGDSVEVNEHIRIIHGINTE